MYTLEAYLHGHKTSQGMDKRYDVVLFLKIDLDPHLTDLQLVDIVTPATSGWSGVTTVRYVLHIADTEDVEGIFFHYYDEEGYHYVEDITQILQKENNK